MKEITEKILTEFSAQDETYTRIVREYALVKDIPGNRELAEKYVRETKDDTYKAIQAIVDAEIKAQEAAAGEPEGEDSDAASLLKKANAIAVINAEISGSEDYELIGLMEQYRGTEYFNLLATLLKPRIREMKQAGGGRSREADKLVMQFETTVPGAEKVKALMDGIRTIQYFNPLTITLGVQPTGDERFLLGNGQRRSIPFDLDNATADFNPLGANQEPLTSSESVGKYTVKSVRYRFKWNQE